MKKFVFEIHGGFNPQDLSKEKMKEVMGKWSAWFGTYKDQVVDSGSPFGPNGTSVTVVLIGAKTSERDWVKYEIDESLKRNNGLLGIYIHKCPLFDRSTDAKGVNPFDNLYFNKNGTKTYLSTIYKTYDWVDNNGRENFGSWIEVAAKAAGR